MSLVVRHDAKKNESKRQIPTHSLSILLYGLLKNKKPSLNGYVLKPDRLLLFGYSPKK